jgi:hypothetical protein
MVAAARQTFSFFVGFFACGTFWICVFGIFLPLAGWSVVGVFFSLWPFLVVLVVY